MLPSVSNYPQGIPLQFISSTTLYTAACHWVNGMILDFLGARSDARFIITFQRAHVDKSIQDIITSIQPAPYSILSMFPSQSSSQPSENIHRTYVSTPFRSNLMRNLILNIQTNRPISPRTSISTLDYCETIYYELEITCPRFLFDISDDISTHNTMALVKVGYREQL